jgi:6-phosphofructokinase
MATKVCLNRGERFRSITRHSADYCRAGERFSARRTRGRFSAKVGHGESRALPKELLEGVKVGMEALGLFALVSIGGDSSLSIAQQLFEYGIPVVGVPKTIDNDLEGTLFTFGFDSAVACAEKWLRSPDRISAQLRLVTPSAS